MVRSANLRKFKSPLITDYFPHISVQKITHFLSNQSKSWCKFFPAPALLKPTPHKDFRRFFFFYPLSAKINTSPHRQGYNNFFSSLFVYSGSKFDSYLIITGMDNMEAGPSDEEVSLHGTLTPRPDLKQTAGDLCKKPFPRQPKPKNRFSAVFSPNHS